MNRAGRHRYVNPVRNSLTMDAAAAPPRISTPVAAMIVVALALVAGPFLAPAGPFIVNGEIYYAMARAMADHGTLHIAANGGVEGAPALTRYLSVGRDGLVYPQYPGGYAFVAAPFYMAFGIRGLMLMNALATALSLVLTYAIALRLFDKRTAIWAAGILGAATFVANYAFAIWPHIFALSFWLGAVWRSALSRWANCKPQKRSGNVTYISAQKSALTAKSFA